MSSRARYTLKRARADRQQGAQGDQASFARVRQIFTLLLMAIWRDQTWGYRAALIGAFTLLASGRLFGFFIAISLGWLVDYLSGPNTALMVALGLLAIYASTQFFSTLVEVLGNLLFALPQGRSQVNLASKVFSNLIQLPLSFHVDQRTGGLANAFDRGTEAIGRLTSIFLFGVLPILLQLLIAQILITRLYGWAFLPLVAGICLIAAWTTFSLSRWYRRLVARALETDDRISEQAVDSLMNIEAVKVFNRTDYELARLTPLWEIERVRILRLGRAAEAMRAANTGIQALSVLMLGSYMAWNVIHGPATAGDFVAFVGIINQLFLPIRQLSAAYRNASRAEQDASRFFGFLNETAEETAPPDPKPLNLSAPALTFTNLKFGFPDRPPLFEGLNLHLPAGKQSALVGLTGSGKSTLAKLALGLETPTSGHIDLHGQDLTALPLSQVRSTIALTPQNTGIFSESIAFNLRFGRPDATQLELEGAAKDACFHDFVQSLPHGYETRVGEGGQKLSGGERQRLAIARSLLREAKIYIFDEATSALDLTTEARIMANIRQRLAGKTLIFIAHRLTTIQHVDTIFVLDHGRLVEQGSHQQLQALKGIYNSLWRTQDL